MKVNTNFIDNYISENKLSKLGFCKKCNVSYSTFYKIYQGKQVNLKSIIKIALTMNIELKNFASD